MITKLTIRNFKKIKEISFELGNPVVLIGPNNSGKTTILQALTLWDIGMRKWAEKKKNEKFNQKQIRTGIAINRKDLFSLPVPQAKLMWFKQQIREASTKSSKSKTQNIRIEIEVEGEFDGKPWISCLEFDFANAESIYCRPLRSKASDNSIIDIDDIAYSERVSYLQPMSGLASEEDKLTPGSIDVRVGLGKTADVLRNIIFQLVYPEKATISSDSEIKWNRLKDIIKKKFLIEINKPEFIPETGLIEMSYIEEGVKYDLSSGGRGFHQTLLLLSYIYSNPGRIILLDEPDAHLEVIRQRDIYKLLKDETTEQNSQLIIASHSEVVLNEAGNLDSIVAIFGNETHNLNNSQDISYFKKSLTEIGWDKYYYAKLKGHIFYLEGSTDFKMLEEFAKLLNHPLANIINTLNIHYLTNNLPNDAIKNFKSIKHIIQELKGIALFDRLDKSTDNPTLKILTWKRREFENYFGYPFVLERLVEPQNTNLFNSNNLSIMQDCIKNNTPPRALNDLSDKWWTDTKISTDYLDIIFEEYANRLNIKSILTKNNYYKLIKLLNPEEVNQEITEKLDEIYEIVK